MAYPMTFPMTRDFLQTAYVDEGQSLAQIAAQLGCSADLVRKRLIEYGLPLRKVGMRAGRGSQANGWRGGRIQRGDYIALWRPDHPAAVNDYVLEHRLVVEASLGRFLRPDEVVHHRNHIKTDNRLENLEVLSPEEHLRRHYPKGQPVARGRHQR